MIWVLHVSVIFLRLPKELPHVSSSLEHGYVQVGGITTVICVGTLGEGGGLLYVYNMAKSTDSVILQNRLTWPISVLSN